MKIVIDSNIFVSSFFWKGNPRKVFDRVIDGFDELYITDDILEEIKSVMSRKKFDLEKNEIDDYLKIIENFSRKITHNDTIENISRDLDDNKILKCGLEANVDFIITGDNDLLILEYYKAIKIVNPKEYLEITDEFRN
ncbi:MAG: putative toxin-antitoxin system toxin component, PIN family [Spirochaetes bacterium]|nr:putative toxin-antitoxin system toxin component, PIN family [Spirochaetota bacterium]